MIFTHKRLLVVMNGMVMRLIRTIFSNKILLAILLIACTFNYSFAEIKNPLDTISKSKKLALLKFGSHISSELTAKKVIESFVNTYKVFPNSNSHFKIPSTAQNQIIEIDIAVLRILNYKDFDTYILALYIQKLSKKDLKNLNSLFESELGKQTTIYMRKTLLDSNFVDNNYSAFEFEEYAKSDFFDRYKTAEDYVYKHMIEILMNYVEDKAQLSQSGLSLL